MAIANGPAAGARIAFGHTRRYGKIVIRFAK